MVLSAPVGQDNGPGVAAENASVTVPSVPMTPPLVALYTVPSLAFAWILTGMMVPARPRQTAETVVACAAIRLT